MSSVRQAQFYNKGNIYVPKLKASSARKAEEFLAVLDPQVYTSREPTPLFQLAEHLKPRENAGPADRFPFGNPEPSLPKGLSAQLIPVARQGLASEGPPAMSRPVR